MEETSAQIDGDYCLDRGREDKQFDGCVALWRSVLLRALDDLSPNRFKDGSKAWREHNANKSEAYEWLFSPANKPSVIDVCELAFVNYENFRQRAVEVWWEFGGDD